LDFPAGLILTAKGVTYTFHDTEDEMYLPIHLQRHPFGRVPALQHDDFMLYETSAIAAYVDDVLPGPKLTPADPRKRALPRHLLGLRAEGQTFTITFGGRQLFTATDRTIAGAGKIALWTKADSVTRFDAIAIKALP
jgi:glutathione S-transferase